MMSLNSSSSSNSSHLPPAPGFIFDLYAFQFSCFHSPLGVFTTITFTAIGSIVFLPLCSFVLYLGLQRRRRRSASSHSDVFTYHIAVVELMTVLQSFVFTCSIASGLQHVLIGGVYLFFFNLSVEASLHILTCVERYLAVVHPVFYLRLREARWIRVRNAGLGLTWLLCLVATAFLAFPSHTLFFIIYSCFTLFFMAVVSFCSISVLCVLIRPGPGEGGGARRQVDQSKLRAFYTIMAILGVLVLRFVSNMFMVSLYFLPLMQTGSKCAVFLGTAWLCLPSGLVLPLLFLNRAGKLQCCKNSQPGDAAG